LKITEALKTGNSQVENQTANGKMPEKMFGNETTKALPSCSSCTNS